MMAPAAARPLWYFEQYILTTIVDLVSLPHPAWLWVVGVAELNPAAYAGAWLARGRQPPRPLFDCLDANPNQGLSCRTK